MTESPHPAETSDPRASPARPVTSSWVVSLLFWCCLLSAALSYAAVMLAPRAAEWLTVRQQYSRNANRLTELEDDVDYMERVAAALESDPEFARRLAHAMLPSDATQSDVLPVPAHLLYGGEQQKNARHEVARLPAGAAWVMHLNGNPVLRRVLLAFAALSTVFAFTFLNDSENGYVRRIARSIGWLISVPKRRYRPGSSEARAEDSERPSAEGAASGE